MADDRTRPDAGTVFKALADPTRRQLLDRLFENDGQTLGELSAGLSMSRFGAMKHLRLLEQARLVVTRRSGLEKLHHLNAVPIQLIHEPRLHALQISQRGVQRGCRRLLFARACAVFDLTRLVCTRPASRLLHSAVGPLRVVGLRHA